LGRRLPTRSLELTLDSAIRLAESGEELPEIWRQRVQRIAESPSKTYIAALGTALLAKATDERVDVLTIKSKAGPDAYSMRGVVRVLVSKAPLYGYHLGVTRREPLNNQPWFSADRVDRMENVRRDVQPFHRDMVRYLSDLNEQSAEEAFRGLAAFLALRIEYAQDAASDLAQLRVGGVERLEDLYEIVQMYVQADTEGGRKGQAVVAAALDVLHRRVRLAAINDPTAVDVAVEDADGRLVLGVEVKQKPVDEADALTIAAETARRGADKAMLVAIAPGQRPLDKERLRRQAEASHGVALQVAIGVVDLLSCIISHSSRSAGDFATEFPSLYLRRLEEHGVSQNGLNYWADLCASLPR
jgi:hypothetical protein